MSLKLVGDNFDYSDCIAYNFEFWIPNFTKSFNLKMFLILNIIFLFVYGIMICLWLIPIINLLKLKLEKISKFCIITHKQEYKEMNIYIYFKKNLKSTYLGQMGVKEFVLGDLIWRFGVFCLVSVVIKGRSCYTNGYVTISNNHPWVFLLKWIF